MCMQRGRRKRGGEVRGGTGAALLPLLLGLLAAAVGASAVDLPDGVYRQFSSVEELVELAARPEAEKLMRAAPGPGVLPLKEDAFRVHPNTSATIDMLGRIMDGRALAHEVSYHLEPGNTSLAIYNAIVFMPDQTLRFPWVIYSTLANSLMVFNAASSDPVVQAWLTAFKDHPEPLHYDDFTIDGNVYAAQSSGQLRVLNSSFTVSTAESMSAWVARHDELQAEVDADDVRVAAQGRRRGSKVMGVPLWSFVVSITGIVATVVIIVATVVKIRRQAPVLESGLPSHTLPHSSSRHCSSELPEWMSDRESRAVHIGAASHDVHLSDFVSAAESSRFHSFQTNSTSAFTPTVSVTSSTAPGGFP